MLVLGGCVSATELDAADDGPADATPPTADATSAGDASQSEAAQSEAAQSDAAQSDAAQSDAAQSDAPASDAAPSAPVAAPPPLPIDPPRFVTPEPVVEDAVALPLPGGRLLLLTSEGPRLRAFGRDAPLPPLATPPRGVAWLDDTLVILDGPDLLVWQDDDWQISPLGAAVPAPEALRAAGPDVAWLASEGALHRWAGGVLRTMRVDTSAALAAAEPDAASTGPVVGLPRWVIYNVGASVFYAAMVAGLIHYAWNTSAGSSEEKDTEPADRHDGGAGQ